MKRKELVAIIKKLTKLIESKDPYKAGMPQVIAGRNYLRAALQEIDTAYSIIKTNIK